jgi:ATP-dependent Clp protease ATP-binding subunit ClpC
MAVANNEFEKARFYADEERKQREALSQLHQKYNIPYTLIVTRGHIEEALARWTGTPVAAIRQKSSNAEIEAQRPVAAPKLRAKRPKKKTSS